MPRFAITADHRHHFQTEGAIEFADLLSLRHADESCDAIDLILANRMGCAREQLYQFKPDQIELAGRDVEFEKLTHRRGFAQVFAELLFKAPIRFGYSQLLVPGQTLYSEKTRLEEVSAYQGLLGGLILCLKGKSDDKDSLFNLAAGEGVFFSGEYEIDWEALATRPENCRYLLIAYAGKSLVYRANQKDPSAHRLKDSDYVFGDSLTIQTHPQLASKC